MVRASPFVRWKSPIRTPFPTALLIAPSEFPPSLVSAGNVRVPTIVPLDIRSDHVGHGEPDPDGENAVERQTVCPRTVRLVAIPMMWGETSGMGSRKH